VVKGIDATKWRTLLYNVILLPASVIPYTLDMVGTTYLVAAAVTGLAYLAITIQFVLKPITRSAALKLFSFSNLYLLLLFIFMFVSSRSFY
jgi:protoheme IX farnesyltransferase